MTDRNEGLEQVAGALHDRLVHEAAEGGGDAAARIAALVEREAALLSDPERVELERLVAERSFGLGPLEPLLADPSVDEVMVNGPGRVWVERHGRIEPTAVVFGSVTELRDAIERILAPLGRRVDEAEPLCNARLADGTLA
jgi:pilus assembly protein CpaF